MGRLIAMLSEEESEEALDYLQWMRTALGSLGPEDAAHIAVIDAELAHSRAALVHLMWRPSREAKMEAA